MEKEFVTIEQAKALFELGYDLPAVKRYFHMTGKFADDFDAPLKQQVFRWFREKYNLSPNIWSGKIRNIFYGYDILHIKKQKFVINNTELGGGDCDYDSYEEAENACIDKLIEIAKQ